MSDLFFCLPPLTLNKRFLVYIQSNRVYINISRIVQLEWHNFCYSFTEYESGVICIGSVLRLTFFWLSLCKNLFPVFQVAHNQRTCDWNVKKNDFVLYSFLKSLRILNQPVSSDLILFDLPASFKLSNFKSDKIDYVFVEPLFYDLITTTFFYKIISSMK